jgi:hypothetical protein
MKKFNSLKNLLVKNSVQPAEYTGKQAVFKITVILYVDEKIKNHYGKC